MDQYGKQGRNGSKNPARGKAPPGPGSGPDLANLPPARGNTIKKKAVAAIVSDVVGFFSASAVAFRMLKGFSDYEFGVLVGVCNDRLAVAFRMF
ncbi:hypothetical protein CMV_003005 [Castanea mollissima]|uniref:Uncharacterized protein n=1 Tax=Castanea mollissima TaxID=60419 RepID=A0A8J4RPH1_9ROSI|nr:hypothetical protein CMV_003005 [Castanea mollissima]